MRKKIGSKIMALLYCCLTMVMLPTLVNAIGMDNSQAVIESEKQKTEQMLETMTKEIEDEIQLLEEELKTNQRCAVERLKTITSLVVVTRTALLERESFLKQLKDTKGILETKTIK